MVGGEGGGRWRASSRNDRNILTAFSLCFPLIRTRGPRGLYGGVVPAVVGAIPSSALYFGAYESIKRRLRHLAERDPGARGTAGVRLRPAVHMVSAASGNMLSSLIFVPKEIVKQKRQTAVALGEDASSAIKVVVGMLQSKVSTQALDPVLSGA